MKIEILMTGNELLSGEIFDTNGPWIINRLFSLGIETGRKTVVGDSLPEISDAILESAARGCDFLIVCGGLGPTGDDKTREAASIASGSSLTTDDLARKFVLESLNERSLPLTTARMKQAMIPAGALPLYNPSGTAPGFEMKISECRTFFLPGPPLEFCNMAKMHVFPELEVLKNKKFFSLTLKTLGKAESDIESSIAPLLENYPDANAGFLLKYPEVHVRISVKPGESVNPEERCLELAQKIEKKLGDIVFGKNEETLESVIADMLIQRKKTLSLAESCTGGLLSSLLTKVPGASAFLLGSTVAYSNDMKIRLLNVPQKIIKKEGAVSAACAEAMALGALEKSLSDHALSITGIAGPSGGTEDKPVGTVWIAHADRKRETFSQKMLFYGDRNTIRHACATMALNLLRKKLKE